MSVVEKASKKKGADGAAGNMEGFLEFERHGHHIAQAKKRGSLICKRCLLAGRQRLTSGTGAKAYRMW